MGEDVSLIDCFISVEQDSFVQVHINVGIVAVRTNSADNGFMAAGAGSVAGGANKAGPAVVRVTHNKNSFPDK